MTEIISLSVDGRTTNIISDNKHPTISFIVDYKDEVSKIDKITLEINNHQIDVSDKTYYRYEYDDLKPFTDYKVTLTIHSEQVITKSTIFKTGFLGNKWPYPFISNPKYVFKEKKISLMANKIEEYRRKKKSS